MVVQGGKPCLSRFLSCDFLSQTPGCAVHPASVAFPFSLSETRGGADISVPCTCIVGHCEDARVYEAGVGAGAHGCMEAGLV